MKTKKPVEQELDSYFDKLMRITTNPDFPISVDIMRNYVVGPAKFKTMMHIILDELDRGAQAVYLDAMEARLRLDMDVTV